MDHYTILGIQKTATQTQIKRAFRELAKKYHPDKNAKENEKFKKINEAYNILGNPESRKKYDDQRNNNNIVINSGNGMDDMEDDDYKEAMKGYNHAMKEMHKIFNGDPFFTGLANPTNFNSFGAPTIKLNIPQGAKVNFVSSIINTKGRDCTVKPKEQLTNNNNNNVLDTFLKESIAKQDSTVRTKEKVTHNDTNVVDTFVKESVAKQSEKEVVNKTRIRKPKSEPKNEPKNEPVKAKMTRTKKTVKTYSLPNQ